MWKRGRGKAWTLCCYKLSNNLVYKTDGSFERFQLTHWKILRIQLFCNRLNIRLYKWESLAWFKWCFDDYTRFMHLFFIHFISFCVFVYMPTIQCAIVLLCSLEYRIRGSLCVQRILYGGSFCCCCNTYINNIRNQQQRWFVLCWCFYYFGIESDVNSRTINSILWLMFRANSSRKKT